ncbi:MULTISPECIES: SRPBCC family protein [unclassified Streptomyces]|uniref:SRPBCC family protein n=1 Tax=unclassified Streptomyces TaxID=2593676 RepID=UPI0035E0AECE
MTGPAGRIRHLEESLVVAAPADVVFRLVGDPARMGSLSPECSGVWVLRPRRRPGPLFIGFNRRGARRWFTVCRVLTHRPPAEFSFHVSILGLSIARWTYRLERLGERGTRVTESWQDLRHGPGGTVTDLLGRRFAGTTPAQRVDANRHGMRTTLRRLKTLAESATPPPRDDVPRKRTGPS